MSQKNNNITIRVIILQLRKKKKKGRTRSTIESNNLLRYEFYYLYNIIILRMLYKFIRQLDDKVKLKC